MSVTWQPITQEFGAQIQSVDVSQPIAAAQALVSLWCERGPFDVLGKDCTIAWLRVFPRWRRKISEGAVHVAAPTKLSFGGTVLDQ